MFLEIPEENSMVNVDYVSSIDIVESTKSYEDWAKKVKFEVNDHVNARPYTVIFEHPAEAEDYFDYLRNKLESENKLL